MQNLIVISGPTAVGKSAIAIEIAKYFNTIVISADSRQFYKEIPIGTATPTSEEQQNVPHFFIGNLSIQDYYNAYKFEIDVLNLLEEKFKQYPNIILCGGSGMYIDAVCNGIDDIPDIVPEIRNAVTKDYNTYGIEHLRVTLQKLDPEYYNIVDLKNPARLLRAIEVCIQTGKTYTEVRKNKIKTRDFNIIKIALQLPRDELYSKINNRVDSMLQNGLEQEARDVYTYQNLTPLKTVGYRELFEYFSGITTKEFAIEKIKQNTRNYAKRQITWLHRDNSYTWFEPNQIQEILDFIHKKSR